MGNNRVWERDTVVVNRWSWVSEGLCQSTDTEVWFNPVDSLPVAILKGICEACPVQKQCLEHALANDEYGFWAGTTEDERRRMIGRSWRRT